MAKKKVMREHIWCTTYYSEGHCKDECPVLPNYVATDPTLQKYKRRTLLHSVSYVNPWGMMSIIVAHSNRCKIIPAMHFKYRKSRRVVSVAVLKEADSKALPEVDMSAIAAEDIVEGEVDPPLISNVEKLVMYQGFVQNRVCFVHIATIPSMSPKTIPTC
jgi:hypothetical protein